ncbi:hypothetical protein BCR33DRAFT_793119 [Rhizoclosmatium globosum]|uniref:Uncharacterized protein n=1 Tax=Rhizoclosmatium globosum TaxID=329046 RepID=A0A1Y2B2W9_9FUNG|nr:hypothetical protein BCR33DRAFT_793119 [Rhizoclosmatium globosum]|eukprot:ORY29076.1 hypothetical protein BCR33DRAFT_793119 [Rhizoclosmatium globosum]
MSPRTRTTFVTHDVPKTSPEEKQVTVQQVPSPNSSPKKMPTTNNNESNQQTEDEERQHIVLLKRAFAPKRTVSALYSYQAWMKPSEAGLSESHNRLAESAGTAEWRQLLPGKLQPHSNNPAADLQGYFVIGYMQDGQALMEPKTSVSPNMTRFQFAISPVSPLNMDQYWKAVLAVCSMPPTLGINTTGIFFKGNLQFTKWLNSCAPDDQHAPYQGNSTTGFTFANPVGDQIEDGAIPTGSLVAVGFSFEHSRGPSSVNMKPAWVTMLKNNDNSLSLPTGKIAKLDEVF